MTMNPKDEQDAINEAYLDGLKEAFGVLWPNPSDEAMGHFRNSIWQLRAARNFAFDALSQAPTGDEPVYHKL